MNNFEKFRAVFEKIAYGKIFSTISTLIIVFYSVLIGVRTFEEIATPLEHVMTWLDILVTGFFILEIIVKMAAAKKWTDFFKDGWNIFDFAIVVISLIPTGYNELALASRILRVFRLLRLFKARPELKKIIDTIFSAFPAIIDVTLLLFIVVYISAVVGNMLFRNLPSAESMASLQTNVAIVQQVRLSDLPANSPARLAFTNQVVSGVAVPPGIGINIANPVVYEKTNQLVLYSTNLPTHVVTMTNILTNTVMGEGVVQTNLTLVSASQQWTTLFVSMLTLFEILTYEGWVAVMDEVNAHIPMGWIFFVSFIMLGVFIAFNLFIAILGDKIQSYNEAEAEKEAAEDEAKPETVEDLVAKIELRNQAIAELTAELKKKA